MLVGAALVQGVAAADWKIEAYAGSNGAISPSGIIFVSEGNDQLFILSPNVGYLVSDVTVDGSSVGAVLDYRFVNVVSNHTIRATFVRSAYTIDASAGQGGTISPSGSITVNGGKSQIFTITPGHDYHIADVIVDGSSVGSVSSYPFTNVQSNHVIQATFSPDPGSFYVNSVPPKAVIYLDDNSVGTTPNLVKDVTPGVHTVRLAMIGYEE
ncbi:MAG: PEGA domain-containing protein, partial [Methanoregulaceae archaeon]|nr:PEGA domain-containing protein [Methanoregulaceae archaeon]